MFGFSGRSKRKKAFHDKGLDPKIVFTATDADQPDITDFSKTATVQYDSASKAVINSFTINPSSFDPDIGDTEIYRIYLILSRVGDGFQLDLVRRQDWSQAETTRGDNRRSGRGQAPSTARR